MDRMLTFTIGISLYSIGVSAASVGSTAPANLYEDAPNAQGKFYWLSSVNDTIFGEDATGFDYHMSLEDPGSIESIETYAEAFTTGDQAALLLAFVNATASGTVTPEQGSNRTWLCNDLGSRMARQAQVCQGVIVMDPIRHPADTETEVDDDNVDLEIEKRRPQSRWHWVLSGAHLASKAAMEVVQRTLQADLYADFNKSPRSYYEVLDNVKACLSWSRVAPGFSHYYAQQLVTDALNVVDFNHKSAEAYNILNTGSRKRALADVCLSNRPKHCT